MGTRYGVDADGDVEMSTPQPVYEFIKAPRLAGWDQASLIAWNREWEQYVMKIRHRCNVTGESFEGIVATVKGSVEPAVLKTLATYVLKKPVEDVDDAEILAQVQKRCKSLKNAFIPDVTTLFRKQLKMDMTVDDCDARVFKYFQAFTKIVEDNGLQALIGSGDVTSLGYKDRMKARCSILVENIQPTMLREQIERLIKYERRDCKTNDATLFDLILEHARVQQRFHSQAGERTTPQSRAQAPQQQSKRTQKSAKPSHPAGVKKVRTPPRDGCLVCRGPHWLDECPTATSEQRADALVKLRAAKNARQESVQSKAVLATARPNMVRVNGMVEIPYVPDSGADRTMISRSVVASLAEFSPDLKLLKLEAPVAVYLADGRRIECLEKATVALELVTAAGPVHMRDIECLVLDSDVEELLLGNDAMKSLGIDVERMIEQLAGASLLDEEKDEFPVGDELIPTNSGEDGVLDQLVDEALANGMPGEHVDRLRSLVHEHGDVFRERLGDDPPALVEPLKVTLTDDAVPFRCKPRKYAPLQSAFLREYTAELEKRGFIRKNNAAKWACAAVPVRKPGSQTEFRITIDYRPVNKVTVPIAGAMPNLAVVSSSVRGARYFAKFDMIKGFWQLPLDVDSQELMSFMTEDTVYTPTRVPQGAVDSAIHFQMQMQDAMAPMLQRNALVWVDDVIIFAPTVEEFLQALKEFFIILRDRRLKLSAAKSSLFQLEVLWCGKLISGSGVRHDPERVDALSALPVPSTVAELQYFVCASNWLHDSLPDYARVVAPLQERLGMERKRIGRRNRNALNVAVTLTEAEITSYNEVKTLIKASVPLVFPSPTSELVVMTDASLTGWSIVVTEVQAWDDSLPVDKQQHRMVLCKGGTFKDSQLNWAIVEKEAFPIVKACTDLEYLLQRERGFKLFCDHANLIYIFAPHVELKKHVRDRLQRWAMRLCGLRFTIEHVAGETNVWADIISRWKPSGVRAAAVRTRSQPRPPALRPLADEDFRFPALEDIVKAQRAVRTASQSLSVEHQVVNGVIMVAGKMWVPSAARQLLLRLMVVAHCGSQGHRSEHAVFTVLNDRFYIEKLHHKVQRFVGACLLCKHVKGPRVITRVYGPTFTATRRNEMVHWDYLQLGDGFGGDRYVLVVKDGLSHYCELFACSSANANVAADALLSWYKRYGCPEMMMSDQGSHFRNETLKILCGRLKIEQHFSLVYTPWVNGTVERLNRDVLQVLRVMLMEYHLDHHEWPFLLPVIQANLNQTPVRSLAGKCPMELFLALPPPSALNMITRPGHSDSITTIDLANVADSLEKVRSSLAAMHRDAIDVKEKKRLYDMATAKGTTTNFDVGDYVLWSRVDERLAHNKLLAQWVGPFVISEARPHSFMIRHLLTGSTYEVHGSRLRFYADSSLDVTEEILEFVSNQGMLLGVDEFSDHRYNADASRWELLVKWTGLQDIEASWEPLKSLKVEVPIKVRDYATTVEDEAFAKAVEQA